MATDLRPASTTAPRSGWYRLADALRRALVRLREFHATQVELTERLMLLDAPWEEELMHWGPDGELHGHLPPPARGPRRSVTSSGWCPGSRRGGMGS